MYLHLTIRIITKYFISYTYTSGTVHNRKQVSNTSKVTLDCGLTANRVNTY